MVLSLLNKYCITNNKETLQKIKMKKEIEQNILSLKKKKSILSQQYKEFSNNLTKLSYETSNYGIVQEVFKE